MNALQPLHLVDPLGKALHSGEHEFGKISPELHSDNRAHLFLNARQRSGPHQNLRMPLTSHQLVKTTGQLPVEPTFVEGRPTNSSNSVNLRTLSLGRLN
jgi:hypothetical protein